LRKVCIQIFYSKLLKLVLNFQLIFASVFITCYLDQGSVEGIDYEMSENILYWTNSYASISRLNLSQQDAVPEVILKLGQSDRPRGIAIDICEM